MEMEPDLDRVQQRARRYRYDDGLAEIATGVVFVAIGLLFLAEFFRIVPPALSSFGLIAVVFAGWWLAGRAVRAAKDRITHPRTGFVRYRRETVLRSLANMEDSESHRHTRIRGPCSPGAIVLKKTKMVT